MKNISLHEFQNITGLSDKALLSLLKSSKLPLELKEDNKLLIDIEAISTEQLITARCAQQNQSLSMQRESIKESLALIIRTKLDDLLEEAAADLLK